MAEVSEAQPAAVRTSISGSSIITDHGHRAATTSAELIIPTTLLTPTIPTPAPSSCLPSTSQETPLISSGSQLPVAAVPLPSAHVNSVSVVSSMAVDSVAAVTASLSVPDSHAAASLASGSMYNASVSTTLASENGHRNSVTTTQAYSTAQLEKALGYRLDSSVSSASSSVLLGSGTASTDSAAVSLAGSLLSSGNTGLSGTSAMSSGGSVVVSGSHKGKKSGGKKSSAAAAAVSNPTPSSASTAALSAADALAASAAAECDLTGGASHKLLQSVRSNPLPLPLPVPTYSQTVQAARASGNVLAERATIIRETVKFFLGHKYWWTTEDYDRIAELVVNQFPELRDHVTWPTSTPCFNKVRLDLSMCARNIRRIAKNQEKRKGSPVQTGKEASASGQAEPPPPPPTPKAPKGGGKGRRKSSMTPSISVPTMVTLASAAQMLPHTAHTAAVHTTLSSQDPKELGNLPYLLTSTSPITTTTTATTTTNSCTVLPPVAHFLGHPSTHSHTTGGIVFPPLLPATHSTPTSQPSPPAPLSPVPAVPKVSHTPVDVGRTTTETGQAGYADNTLSLSGAWRADAQLPDPLPVPPYSEKVMKAKKMGVTKYERPLIIRETVLFFLSLKYWWSSVDYDRISHFVVDYFPDLKDPMLSPNMPPNRRVRTDLSQTARNIRRREVMLRRKDTRSPEERFTAVGTASLPPHSNQQVSSNFCDLLAAASIIENRGALENHAQVSRDLDAIASVNAHTSKDMQQGSVAPIEDGKEAGDSGGKETSEVGKYPYNILGAGLGGVEGGGGNCQLAVIKQEAGEVDPYQQQQAWLSAQAMTQALSIQALSSSLSALPPHVSQALSDHLLSSHTPNTLTPAPPAAHQNPGASNGGEGLSTPAPPSQSLSSSYTLSTPGAPSSLSDAALSEASPMDRMSAMAMWRSTCLPDPLPVPPYTLNVLRARDSGNTSSARPRIIRETTQFFLALKMWWTTQDYERIAELVLREFPDLKLVPTIKKDLGTCARNMRRRLPMTKNKQWGSYPSPSQVSSKEGEGVGEGGGVTLGELATMASLREAQDKGRGEVGVVVSVAEDPCHSLLAQSVYDQNAWNLFYQQQFSTPDPAPALPPPRASKRSLSDATGSKGHEVGEKELTEALKQAVAQSVKQVDMDSGVARRHSVDVGEASKVREMKQEVSGKTIPKVTSSEVSKSDNYPVMKELISHPALSVRDPKLTTDYTNWTAHIGSVGEGGTSFQHPTPARAHSQPACPLRSDVRISESEEVPMNLTCAPTSEGSKRGKSPKAVKTEAKASKKGGSDTFSAREQVWFPHGSPWKKTGQNMFKALPSPLPAPKYSQKLLKAREEGLAYRHRSEIIRETARYFLVLKYWWSSADYSRISELVVNQFPDLKDPITPPGQPCYRRVQRDLSMCARNLRRKNTRQQQLSSGETASVACPKRVKGGSKEKKSKKVTGIKVEATGELAGLGSRVGEGGVVESSVVGTTPLVSSPSNAALTQAMLQASVDQALASISPLPALPSTTPVTSTPSWTLPQPHVTNATILSHLVSPVTTATPLSLAHTTLTTTLPATHTTVAYPSAYPTVQPPAYSTVHSTTPSSAHTVSVVMSAPGAVTGKDGRADRTLWPVVVPANGLSESVGSSKASAKKKSGAASRLGQASAKQGQGAPKSGQVTAKSVASIQPKVEKRVAAAVPSIHPPQGQEEGGGHTLPQAGSGGRGRGPSGGVAHVTGTSKKSKDSARHLTSRSGEGRSQSNTTAIITPTLSEAHVSAAATSSEGGSVADKVYINPEHGSELQRQLIQLWQEGKFFDASLEVDNYRLPAHKLVLLAASPYLQSTFRHANPTSHLEVNLPRDTGVEAARSFLKYVYQGVLHVTPDTVQALRRIAAMLQINQLLVYCDEFLLQLSASSASGSSAVAVPHRRASVPHASSQVRRVSVNLREPTQPHPLTTEPNPAQPLPGSATQVAAGTAQYRLSPEQHQRPNQSSSARKRRASSLASPLDGQQRYVMGEREGREGVEAFSARAEGDKQKGFEGSSGQQRQQEGDLVPAKRFRSSDLAGVESVSSKAYLDSQAYQSFSGDWHHPVEDSRPQSVLAQHLSAEKIPGRAPTSSVIHRGPNLLAASAEQGELTSSSNMTTSTTTPATGSSSDTTFTTTNGDEGGSVVQYLADAASFAAEGEGGEESVLVRLLPEGQVQMEIGEGGLQFQPAHTMHLPPTIQLSRDQALHLTRDGAIHLGEGGVVHHLTREEALQLAGQAAQQGVPLSEEALSEQAAGEALCVQQQQQQQQLSQEQQLVTLGHNAVVGDMAVQLVEQSIALCGGDGQGTEEGEQGMERVQELGEGQVVCDQERWEGEEVVVQGGEGMMVEEVIVQSGDLLQDVDVAACETVECSLLPQTYCSSPEDCAPCPTPGEEDQVGGQALPGEAVERVEESGEQALQTLASQWVRQQYANAPLDADTARQFVAALQERMYGQPSTTSASLQPPPAYPETLYVQPCGDGETVYVSQTMEGEELVVETSEVTDTAPQPAGLNDDGDSHTSLLPQTYCSSSPRSQSPSVST